MVGKRIEKGLSWACAVVKSVVDDKGYEKLLYYYKYICFFKKNCLCNRLWKPIGL
jgi:hypothetical protein